MDLYRYKRIERPADGSGSIRLVKIKRGSAQDAIHVSVDQFLLTDVTGPGAPSWHALSYTWGDLEDTEHIVVDRLDDVDGEVRSSAEPKFLTVTRHLTEFLRTVRSHERDRIMWIDAICIDQAEDPEALKERSWQVRLMHQIYSKATGVVIWLGPEVDDSTYAIRLLDELGSSFSVNWTTFEISTSNGEYSESMNKWAHQYGRNTREFQAVWELLGRDYFTRTWIRQEAILANDESSIVKCGRQEMQLANFRRAMHFLGIIGLEALPVDAPEQIDDRLSSAVTLCQRTYMDEPNLMYRARTSNCRDARDKVYGNLGVMTIMGDARFAACISIDYSPDNATEKVFRDFFQRHHERYGTLRLLSEAGLCQESEMHPTWVPDWRRRIRSLDLSMESASSHFAQAECTFFDDGTLQVLGSRGSVVRELHYLRIDNAYEVSTDWYKELSLIMHSCDSPSQPELLAERMSHAICCAMYTLQTPIGVILGHRQSMVAYFQYLCNESSVSPSELKPPIDMIGHAAAWALEQGVRFLKLSQLPIIICERGLLGIGTRGVRNGDIVTAVLGSRPLILLRPTQATNNSHFQVVGPCFVHGLNWGEALLGPLPKNCVVIPELEPARGAYMPYYQNIETGKTTMWDPRIDWAELEAHPPMLNFQAMPAPPGEPFRVRPDSEYLQRHGIKLERYNLV